METLHIELGASRRLTAWVVVMHVFAGVMLWLSALPPWLAFASMPMLTGSLVFYLRGPCLRLSSGAIVSVSLHPDCRCEFQTKNGEYHDALLLGSSFVAPYLTVLNLRPAGRLARHAVILPDNVDAEAFRKLRVLLKWRCGLKTLTPGELF